MPKTDVQTYMMTGIQTYTLPFLTLREQIYFNFFNCALYFASFVVPNLYVKYHIQISGPLAISLHLSGSHLL